MQQAFSKQVADARFIRGGSLNQKFYEQSRSGYNVNAAIRSRDYDAVLNNFVRTDALDRLQDEAYDKRAGYSIGYVGGKKVMYVSGSRNAIDWVFNVGDMIIPHKHHYASNRTAKRLTAIAKSQNVDVVVGHSRGGMLVSKMDIPNDKKLSLDGAMTLAPKNRRDVMNLYQKQPLDKFIGRGGTNSKSYRMKRIGRAHFISRDRAGYDRYKAAGGYVPKKAYLTSRQRKRKRRWGYAKAVGRGAYKIGAWWK
jgi:hypothetical protein